MDCHVGTPPRNDRHVFLSLSLRDDFGLAKIVPFFYNLTASILKLKYTLSIFTKMQYSLETWQKMKQY
jgi:hypothetical protein